MYDWWVSIWYSDNDIWNLLIRLFAVSVIVAVLRAIHGQEKQVK